MYRLDINSFSLTREILHLCCPTFGLVADPLVDLICSFLGPAEVQSSALAVEVGFVGGNKGLLHGETLVREHAVGDQHNVLIGLSRQGLVQLPQHLVRSCAGGGHSCSES